MLEGGFHGRTMGALSATPQEAKQAPFAPLVPGFRVVPRDDAARARRGRERRTAAVLIEPIQGESGIHPISTRRCCAAAREACDEHGALLIFDEIQCGMGRTGTLWACEHSGVTPGRDDGRQGPRRRPADRRVRRPRPSTPTCSQPGDHGSTFAGGPVVARGRERGARRGRRRRLPGRGPRARASSSPPACASLGLEPRGLGLMVGFDLPRRARRGAPRCCSSSGSWSTPPAPTRSGCCRRSPSPTDEIDEAVRRLGAELH